MKVQLMRQSWEYNIVDVPDGYNAYVTEYRLTEIVVLSKEPIYTIKNGKLVELPNKLKGDKQ